MELHILTLFPAMFIGPFQESILKRAQDAGLLSVHLHDPRDFTHDRHHVVDDTPYGGGPGMLMKPEPLFEAAEAIRTDLAARLGPDTAAGAPLLLMSPRGRPFTQEIALDLAARDALLLLCGRYEGVDARVEEALADDVLSIGDYVLTGGELPAMVVADAVARLLPGVLHDSGSGQEDSFAQGLGGLLQYPQYTRPPAYRGHEVPPLLLSGDHGQVARWRRREALRATLARRPDLLERAELTPEDLAFLKALRRTESGQATSERPEASGSKGPL